eukprot:gnl/TRDRNA2_/TRDRNA2_174937_c1_seq8.p2 gnl/TRDRNA2_/TRDRNA2_174937_c1~~gnl/TRDRNA2_/TRDRNA2_174937_c1_seq8.p2  ORF type:complete len:126 (+),score=10.90 gnl/TRDRNA2_/TRDRNA2_174937_c1_seq8:247-624(+)
MVELCGYIVTTGDIAWEVATAVSGVPGALVCPQVIGLRGYVSAAGDVAWEVAAAIDRMLRALMIDDAIVRFETPLSDMETAREVAGEAHILVPNLGGMPDALMIDKVVQCPECPVSDTVTAWNIT